MKTYKYLWLLFFLFTVPGRPSYSCTIVMASGPGTALAGSNEDSYFPLTLLWFTPASEGNYARVTLGYRLMTNSVQGGMNEMGLFVDGNALGSQGWVADPSKKGFAGSILDYLLARFATVEEVKEFFRTYNVPDLDRARIPVMDRSGASMVVEWYLGEVVFLEPEQSYQVATNFVGSAYKEKEKPGWRYNKAVEVLDREASYSLETVRNALVASHQANEYSQTVYSFICDLKKGEIHVYNYHDFSRSLTFNLKEEIQKGNQEHYLGQLFPERSSDYSKFLEVGPVRTVEMGLNRNPYFALIFFGQLKNEYPKAYGLQITINTLSQVASHLIENNKPEDALVILERNATEFPGFARSHLELAQTYQALNQNEKAIEAYQKALTIEPGNTMARQGLDSLSAEEVNY
jgi:tetratricopeptide (TPR) repeat protein